MNIQNHSVEAALPPATPLFASSWLALFSLLRGRLEHHRPVEVDRQAALSEPHRH